MESKFEELIGGYMTNKFGVSDHFITREMAVQLQKNLIRLNESGRMKKAGIGNQQVKDVTQDKRGDKIFWIENKTTDAPERAFLQQIEEFIVYLNETCYAGINDYEFHYALYETGNGYQRHVDQFQNNSERKFSLVSYLNADWLVDDGGELMIYQEDKIEKIIPSMQKTVFFQSNSCEHSVSKSSRSRMSITGWLKSC